ncbi:MAG: tRNA uridine-5-carboxymethylaminomethyl(34) synthesis enzyme MnmG [Chlamydiota bacterium]|nr:tRNA uridine-5-carboxymethylaminomethyl(34) synthesis enzyme MnmG [Chlamydiota bacterium]
MCSKDIDIIVVGAGHAGCEAALASSRMSMNTVLITMDISKVAKMSCNPAIGGVAKGHIVREIDALGGEMGKNIDKTSIQFQMLNKSKGPAVWAPRAQADKKLYSVEMYRTIEKQSNLRLLQGTVERIIVENSAVTGVVLSDGTMLQTKAIIITTGTFMKGLCHVGETQFHAGRSGERPCHALSDSLRELGFELHRLKTGTPPRIHKDSIDYSRVKVQGGDSEDYYFSHFPENQKLAQIPCYITRTTDETAHIIRSNIHRSPLYAGRIIGVGPRYCPSIEDKIMRFPDKPNHQVFLEPEGLVTNEVYVNGVSTSLPKDVQDMIIHSISGLEKAKIIRYGYAVEYDFMPPTQVLHSLETKRVQNLFFAGQVNGTSGYEEAAAQGLMAGINATQKILCKPPFTLKRSEAYIGVMIDDLVTKGTKEPYRMFTSRAEHRLVLRQDNADMRLMDYGHRFALIKDEQFTQFECKRKQISSVIDDLKNQRHTGASLYQLLKRPGTLFEDIIPLLNKLHASVEIPKEIQRQVEIEAKYEGYIKRELDVIAKKTRWEEKEIPHSFNYSSLRGLRKEAIDKLQTIQPVSIGQASRISGVTPADITALMIALYRSKKSA